jgi:Tol biopolymer transport system component
MRSPSFRRAVLPRLVALVLPLALGCDGAADPVAPEALLPSTDVAPAEAVAAAGTTQRIAFTTTRKGGYDVFKMDPQGNNVAPLITSAVFEFAPAWSRDNQRLAISRQRSNGTYIHDDIWIMNADGSQGHWARSTATTYDLMFPSWSPDGKRLVLTVSISDVHYVGWMNLATGQLGVYSTGFGGLQGDHASYTPGGQILYLGPTGTTIIRMNADGTNAKTLVSSPTLLRDPAMSRDGKRVAYAKAGSTSFDLYAKTLADGSVKRLTTWDAHFEGQPAWSPDGSRIAFTSNHTGTASQIWTVPATGGAPVQITHTAATERDPAWTF